jgi:hypothetical protein
MTIDERRDDDSSLGDRQEAMKSFAALHRMVPVHVEVEVIPRDNGKQLGYPPLDGEVLLLRLRVQVRGKHAEHMREVSAVPFFVHDGTSYQSIVRERGQRLLPSGNHDLTRALFATSEPAPLGAEAVTRALNGQENRTPSGYKTEGKSYDASCDDKEHKGECQALIPFARVGPGWGTGIMGLDLTLTIAEPHAACTVTDRRTLVLPAGANLEERVKEVFRNGGVDL